MAQLSDVHVGPRTPVPLIRAAIDAANRFEPDLVVLTGDYVSRLNLPLVTPLLLASIREPYARGSHRLGPVQLYVNRGIGMSGIPVRVNAPAEVTLATLRAAPPPTRTGRRTLAAG